MIKQPGKPGPSNFLAQQPKRTPMSVETMPSRPKIKWSWIVQRVVERIGLAPQLVEIASGLTQHLERCPVPLHKRKDLCHLYCLCVGHPSGLIMGRPDVSTPFLIAFYCRRGMFAPKSAVIIYFCTNLYVHDHTLSAPFQGA